MPTSPDAEVVTRAAQSMVRICQTHSAQFPALQAATTATRLSRFGTDITRAIMQREDVTSLARMLVDDLAWENVPSEALTTVNEAFCKKLIELLTTSADDLTRLRMVRQVTHAQISIRMVITNANLQNLLKHQSPD